MTGRRLTHGDRRSIATWLGEGAGYAEIARRLGRPTSTISREVARNGHRSYDPDRAQRRTSGRPAAVKSPAGLPADDHAEEFVEELASSLASTGMPRMPARVFTALLVAADGLTAQGLVHQLRVSSASVSKSIGYLEGMSLVTREVAYAGRRERYLVDDDVWLRALQTDSGAHALVAAAAGRAAKHLGADSPAGSRLSLMERFFSGLTQIRDTTLADSEADDAATVMAALVHSGRPLIPDDIAVGLGWPLSRVTRSLELLHRRPALGDPLTLETRGGRYAMVARLDRLSTAQQARLRARPRSSGIALRQAEHLSGSSDAKRTVPPAIP